MDSDPGRPPPGDDLDIYLGSLDADALRALLRTIADGDPAVDRLLRVRATAGTPDPGATRRLTAAVTEALRTREFIDYRHSFDVAKDANAVLDELEDHLDAGAPDTVRPALERATTRLRALALQADDSAGVIGDAGQRAVDLHARSCREGSPDGRRLARWLVKFRVGSPGWPEVVLDDHLAGLGDAGLTAYRAAVAGLDPTGDTLFEIERMRLELADHDGDVDAAIDILQHGGRSPTYGGIVRRLRAAGRESEVLGWMDRAIADGRVSGRLGPSGADHWLDPADVARVLLGAGRPDDAVGVLRTEFTSRPDRTTFAALLAFAGELGRREAEREWALAHARSRAGSHERGAVLVDLALGEGDLAAAWAAADEFGAGAGWRDLAEASRDERPLGAAQLYRSEVDAQLEGGADTRVYASVAETLVDVRELHRAAGSEEDFVQYLRVLRETYRRRTSLMTALNRNGL
ncbi:DUF6880 family protein [Pseudonocardia nematodicida]|uniref:DUF6880 family protein n=1 Tax=Pseudonocardia nematodicida TaxID=1206997 RepID=A0ABV1KHC4_9PSEU